MAYVPVGIDEDSKFPPEVEDRLMALITTPVEELNDPAVANLIEDSGSATSASLSATIASEGGALFVPAEYALVTIVHGNDDSVPRGSAPGRRLWVGSVQPVNLLDGVDLWAVPTAPEPEPPFAVPTADLAARFVANQLGLAHGDPVTAWTAHEGSESAVFTIAGAPTFRVADGMTYVETDGVDDALSWAYAQTQPMSLVVIGRTFTLASGTTLAGSTAGGTSLRTIGITSGNLVAYAGSNITGPAADYAHHVFIANFNGSSTELWLDGVRVAGPASAGTNGAGGLRHGANSGLSAFSRLGIAESMVYDRVLTPTEVAEITDGAQAYYAGL